MDAITRLMGKISLLYLVLGFSLGALLSFGSGQGISWTRALSITHSHILFVGWFVQFAIGIGYWLLPRRKSPELPYGYREDVAFTACALLNSGLLLRIVLEPAFYLGWLQGTLVSMLLTLSGILQMGAAFIWAVQLWKRFFRRYSATTPMPAGKSV